MKTRKEKVEIRNYVSSIQPKVVKSIPRVFHEEVDSFLSVHSYMAKLVYYFFANRLGRNERNEKTKHRGRIKYKKMRGEINRNT